MVCRMKVESARIRSYVVVHSLFRSRVELVIGFQKLNPTRLRSKLQGVVGKGDIMVLYYAWGSVLVICKLLRLFSISTRLGCRLSPGRV
jgi:hypothetical protein